MGQAGVLTLSFLDNELCVLGSPSKQKNWVLWLLKHRGPGASAGYCIALRYSGGMKDLAEAGAAPAR